MKRHLKNLMNISCEAKSLTFKEFKEYINEYISDAKGFKIPKTSSYYKTLVWAKSNFDVAFKLLQS